MNSALRAGFGLLIIGLVGLASGCSTATKEIPRTARLEFAKNGLPYKAAVHEYYAWRPTVEALLAPHQLTLVDTDDAWYVVTIDVHPLPHTSVPALSVVNVGLSPKRPKQLAPVYDHKKEYSSRFNNPTHESFKLAEAMERWAQSSASLSSN